MIWMDNATGHARIGLIVAKHRSTAVARNRLRRRLREIWRRELQQTLGPCDLVIRVRREAYGASFAELRAELLAWSAAARGALRAAARAADRRAPGDRQ